VARAVVKGLFMHHAFDHAATMAFYFFLGAIPLLVVVGLLVGSLVQREGAEALAEPLVRAMPRVASDVFRNELYAMANANIRKVAPLSMLGFLWLTTNGIHNVMDVFELLVGATPRAWWKQRLLALAWVATTVTGLAAATWVILILNDVASGRYAIAHLPTVFRRASEFAAQGWQRLGVLGIFLALLSVGVAAFYRIGAAYPPNVRPRVWPGTFVAVILSVLVSWGFGQYVGSIGHYAVFYGSLATIAVAHLWLYLASLALLVGAEVNAQLEGRHEASAVAPTSRGAAHAIRCCSTWTRYDVYTMSKVRATTEVTMREFRAGPAKILERAVRTRSRLRVGKFFLAVDVADKSVSTEPVPRHGCMKATGRFVAAPNDLLSANDRWSTDE
jgi:membrane protein